MATPNVTALQRSDLNRFLFAGVGTEANDMMLSVLSVFARQGSDPWSEAGRLAELTKAEATNILARMIAGMPRGLWSPPEAIAIAVRLTGLLPKRQARDPGKCVANRWSSIQVATIAICVVLAVTYVVITMMRADPPTNFDGSDVGSFTGVAPGDGMSQGKHQ